MLAKIVLLSPLSLCIIKVSAVVSLLRVLLEKDTAWQWDHEHEQSLLQLKELATSPQYWHTSNQIIQSLSFKASSKGLNAVLIQDDHPIAYASRSLSNTQQNYAQIEICCGIWLYKISWIHLWGNQVTVNSNISSHPQKTLVPSILACSYRKWYWQFKCIYSLSVIYRPGKELVPADTLSRAFLQDDDKLLEEKFEVNTLSIIPISDKQTSRVKRQSQKGQSTPATDNHYQIWLASR